MVDLGRRTLIKAGFATGLAGLVAGPLSLFGCGSEGPGYVPSGCTRDTDCKGERVCEAGECVDPSGNNSSSSGDGSNNNGDSGEELSLIDRCSGKVIFGYGYNTFQELSVFDFGTRKVTPFFTGTPDSSLYHQFRNLGKSPDNSTLVLSNRWGSVSFNEPHVMAYLIDQNGFNLREISYIPSTDAESLPQRDEVSPVLLADNRSVVGVIMSEDHTNVGGHYQQLFKIDNTGKFSFLTEGRRDGFMSITAITVSPENLIYFAAKSDTEGDVLYTVNSDGTNLQKIGFLDEPVERMELVPGADKLLIISESVTAPPPAYFFPLSNNWDRAVRFNVFDDFMLSPDGTKLISCGSRPTLVGFDRSIEEQRLYGAARSGVTTVPGCEGEHCFQYLSGVWLP